MPPRLLHPLTYVGVSIVILMVQIMPLGPTIANISGPDVLVAMTLAWVWRRPEMLPIGVIALVSLMFDLILMRPPGLGTALLIVAVEMLRARAFIPGEPSVAIEWFNGAVVIIGLLFVMTLVKTLLFLETGGMALTLSQMALTVAIYPIAGLCVAGLCRIIEPRKNGPAR